MVLRDAFYDRDRRADRQETYDVYLGKARSDRRVVAVKPPRAADTRKVKMAETLKQVYNFDSLQTKRRFMQKVQAMNGLWEISMKPRKLVRSLSQNAFYHVAYVSPFTEWLRDEWGDPSITTEQAHIELKKAVLGVKTKVNERTGEMMELVPTTHDMDSGDFSNFLEKSAEFLARACGIVVLPSEMFFEQRDQKAS